MSYNFITRTLAMGSYPPPGSPIPFDVLVLCAEELQPPASAYPGVTVLHVPLDDADPTGDEILRAVAAGKNVAARLRQGARVLVTCAQGRNRSGLVVGLALEELDVPWATAVRRIRQNRENALTNRAFVRFLEFHGKRAA